jgi:hypothetical protein
MIIASIQSILGLSHFLSQEEQQQLELQFFNKLVWIVFLKLSLNRLQVGTLLDIIRQN